MLAVKRLALSHFRSYGHGQLELDGRPVALYGPNGAGKTNILEAVSMLSPGRGLRRAAIADMARRPECLGWKIKAELESLGHLHELETSVEAGGSRQVRIDGKPASQLALGRLARMVWLVPTMDRLWVEGADGRRRFLDRMTMSFIPAHGEAVLKYEKAMRERNRLLKDQVHDESWYSALETQMAAGGAVIQENRQATVEQLMLAQQQGQTAFPTANLSLTQPEGMPEGIEDQEELRVALSDSRQKDMLAGRSLIGPHRADLAAEYTAKGVAAKDCSTGEQKALLVSLILANGRALKAEFGAAPILLLDEVAAHLDAGRRAALYDEICALGAQAWMTGTGAELFDSLGNRAHYLEVVEGAAASEIVERN